MRMTKVYTQIGTRTTDKFNCDSGLTQYDLISPILFNLIYTPEVVKVDSDYIYVY